MNEYIKKCYILKSDECDLCVWGKDGFYNAICAHCPSCQYSKNTMSNFMTEKLARFLGKIKE